MSISRLAGKKGTFVLSMCCFAVATILMYLWLAKQDDRDQFFLFILILLPVVLFFLYWMRKVWQDEREASFRNSLLMNIIATVCTAAFFTLLIIQNH